MFTKQHYKVIAGFIKYSGFNEYITGLLIEKFVELFTDDNPNFDEEKFREEVNK